MSLGGRVKKAALTSCHETNIRAKLELPGCQAAVEAAVRCRQSSGPSDFAAGLQTETAFYKVGLFSMSGGTLLNFVTFFPESIGFIYSNLKSNKWKHK